MSACLINQKHPPSSLSASMIILIESHRETILEFYYLTSSIFFWLSSAHLKKKTPQDQLHACSFHGKNYVFYYHSTPSYSFALLFTSFYSLKINTSLFNSLPHLIINNFSFLSLNSAHFHHILFLSTLARKNPLFLHLSHFFPYHTNNLRISPT